MTGYAEQWARAFLLTLAVEMPLYLWLLRRRGFSTPSALVCAFIANAVSHPFFWFVFPSFTPYAAFLLAGESLVIAIETAILWAGARLTKADTRAAPLFFIACAVNAVSTVVGLALASASLR